MASLLPISACQQASHDVVDTLITARVVDAMKAFSEPNNEVDNESHQRRFAEMLINAIGKDDAIQWCQQTGWDGTLRAILARARVYDD